MNHSKQRDLIYDYLCGTRSHPTADDVYQAVKPIQPDISLGTVYRNLNLLADNGTILRLHMKDGLDHFDADTSEHFHFYCNNCKRLFDLEMKLPTSLDGLIDAADRSPIGDVEGCMMYFYGACDECRRAAAEKKSDLTDR